MKKIFTGIVTASMMMAFTTMALAGDLTIKVNDLRNDEGRVLVAVFDDAAAFNSFDPSKAIAFFDVKASQKAGGVTLHDLPKGKYAVSVFHDQNANGDFDMNSRGFPEEGFAFSNNVGADTEETKFSDAAFSIGGSNELQEINMIYIK